MGRKGCWSLQSAKQRFHLLDLALMCVSRQPTLLPLPVCPWKSFVWLQHTSCKRSKMIYFVDSQPCRETLLSENAWHWWASAFENGMPPVLYFECVFANVVLLIVHVGRSRRSIR